MNLVEIILRQSVCAFLIAAGVAGSPSDLPAAELVDLKTEKLGEPVYTLRFGDPGKGTDSLEETGMMKHGAYGNGMGLRFFDGKRGGSQANGVYDIAYKNADARLANERVTDLLPNRTPLTGGKLFGGGAFDGTALWVGHSRFKAGQAPPVGDEGGGIGTRWDGSKGPADTGGDVRVSNENLLLAPVVEGVAIKQSWLFSADVFVPDYGTEERAFTEPHSGIFIQPYVDRDGWGLTAPGGLGFRSIQLIPGVWHFLQIRVDVISQSVNVAATCKIVYAYLLDGETDGNSDTFDLAKMLDATDSKPWIQKGKGPVRIGFAAGLERGWQGSAPDAFFDNIEARPIHAKP
ncbi:MAG: hypothetical protein HY360_01105 [Verrucomicrobia bacterium]|nr:hypothetical protein [Verrucomicrobiota bacterium]